MHINSVDSISVNPFPILQFWAVVYSWNPEVQCLISHSADYLHDSNKETVHVVKMAKARELFAACKDGKLNVVQKLVESKKVFPSATVDDRCNGFTPLHHAAT